MARPASQGQGRWRSVWWARRSLAGAAWKAGPEGGGRGKSYKARARVYARWRAWSAWRASEGAGLAGLSASAVTERSDVTVNHSSY